MNKSIAGLFLIISCMIGAFLFGGYSKYDIDPDEKAVNRAIERNTKVLSKKYHLYPIGTVVSMPEGDIRYLAIEFQLLGPLSRSELRKILIDSMQDFLCDINSDAELCRYLKKGSLSLEELGLKFFLIDSMRNNIQDPNIGIASISDGELKYKFIKEKYHDDIKMNLPYTSSMHVETYAEALQALEDTCALNPQN